jgi:hypothetical protein
MCQALHCEIWCCDLPPLLTENWGNNIYLHPRSSFLQCELGMTLLVSCILFYCLNFSFLFVDFNHTIEQNVVLEHVLFLPAYHKANRILQLLFGDVAGKRSLLNSGLLVQGNSMVSLESFFIWFHIYRESTWMFGS